jgi:hypothetical protein
MTLHVVKQKPTGGGVRSIGNLWFADKKPADGPYERAGRVLKGLDVAHALRFGSDGGRSLIVTVRMLEFEGRQ